MFLSFWGFSSTFPTSDNDLATLSIRAKPRGKNAISLPISLRLILTLCLFMRNLRARLILISRSWSEVFKPILISLSPPILCFFCFCIFFSRWYKYFPKSIILATGGLAFGATSTRSNPASFASLIAAVVGVGPQDLPFSSINKTLSEKIASLTRIFFSIFLLCQFMRLF